MFITECYKRVMFWLSISKIKVLLKSTAFFGKTKHQYEKYTKEASFGKLFNRMQGTIMRCSFESVISIRKGLFNPHFSNIIQILVNVAGRIQTITILILLFF